MRFYSFTNANYMSQLQLGLQTAHCVADMATKYLMQVDNEAYDDWAVNHKTIIILNGGNCAMLNELYNFMDDGRNPYPYTKFNEDEQSLAGAITCVGVVLPEEVYETARLIRNRTLYRPDSIGTNVTFSAVGDPLENERLCNLCNFYNSRDQWHDELFVRLNSCGMA